MAREPTSVSPLFEQRMRINPNRTASPTPNSRPTTPNNTTKSTSAGHIHTPDRQNSLEAQSSASSVTPANSAVLTLNPNSMAMVANGVTKPAKNGTSLQSCWTGQSVYLSSSLYGFAARRKVVPECSDIRVGCLASLGRLKC